MAALQKLYRRLRLQINESKSAVAKVCERKFLGFSFWGGTRCKVAKPALETMKERVRRITRRTTGRSLTL